MKHFSIISLLIFFFTIQLDAQIPNGYYDDAQGLNGESLKTALHNIIDGHNSQSYNSIWSHFEDTDPRTDNGNQVWDMYSDNPGGSLPYNYYFGGGDQCGTYSQEGDCYNREHSFPKSWFNEGSPMDTDIFHIVPTDGYVNGQRSSYPFGETNNASWTSENGSKRGSNSTSGYSGIIFEPIDEYKGDFARIYFYMATRYEDVIANWESNGSYADAALDGSSYPCYEEWYLELLIDWHTNDPVSQKEIDRNNEIHDIQNNRNPYVDHPDYVSSVWGGVIAPAITNVSWNPLIPEANETVSVSATIVDDGSISSSVLHYGFASNALNQTVNMTASGNTYTANIPGYSSGTDVYFKISATDNESNESQSSVYQYQVAEEAGTISLPFLEDFNDETLGIFVQYSVTGSEQYWENDDYNSTYFAKMSNYNGSTNIENEDWMITPAINLNDYTGEILEFQSAMQDYSDNSTEIFLKYSLNYSGSGNPNTASWVDLSSQALWSDGDYNWVSSGEIDLSNISGSSVHIAFIYESEDGTGKTWQIDDVSISIDNVSNQPPVITDVNYTPNSPQYTEAVTVTATITDDNSVNSAQILWGYSSGNLSNIVNMTNSGNSFSGIIPAQAAETAVYFKIKATDDENEFSETSVYNYSVQAIPNQAPEISNISFSPTNPQENEVVNITATITDDVAVDNAIVFWGLSESNLSNSVNMTSSADVFSASIPGQAEETTVYFKLQATDDESESTDSEILEYTVQSNQNIAPEISNVVFTPEEPIENQEVLVQANINDDDVVSVAEVLWGLTSSNLNNTATMTANADVYSANIPGQAEETIVYFKVKAVDNEGAQTESDIYQYQVAENENIPPAISNINFTPQEPEANEQVTVTAEITDDEIIESAQIIWGISDDNLNNTEDMTPSGDIFSGVIPGQENGTTVYFKIQAFDNEEGSTESILYEYDVETIIPVQTLPFLESFENESLGIFDAYSVTGENGWHNDSWDDNQYAKMSNFDGSENVENQDWLLTKAINLDNYSEEVLNFSSAMMDYEDLTTFIYLKYSSNYDGLSDPNNADWVDITNLANWSTGEYEWVESGDIDLSTINGSSIYIAFVYDSQDGSGKTWEIDNVSITLDGANEPPVISNITHFPLVPTEVDAVTISANITDDYEIDHAEIQWGFSPTLLDQTINMNSSGDEFLGTIPPQDYNQYVYYRILAVDNEGSETYSSTMNYYVDFYESVGELENIFKLYPNPAQQFFIIESSIQISGQLRLYSVVGDLVYENLAYLSNQKINIENIKDGVYLVSFETRKGKMLKKMIIQ